MPIGFHTNLKIEGTKCETCKNSPCIACCIDESCTKSGPCCYKCIYSIHENHFKNCVPLDDFQSEIVDKEKLAKNVESYKEYIKNAYKNLDTYLKDQLNILDAIKDLDFDSPGDFSLINGWDKFKKSLTGYIITEENIEKKIDLICRKILSSIQEKSMQLFSEKRIKNILCNDLEILNLTSFENEIFLFDDTLYENVIYLKLSSSVNILGLGLFPTMIHESKESEKLEFDGEIIISSEEEKKNVLITRKIQKNENSKYHVNYIYFSKPVQIMKNKLYSIKINYQLPGTYFMYSKIKEDTFLIELKTTSQKKNNQILDLKKCEEKEKNNLFIDNPFLLAVNKVQEGQNSESIQTFSNSLFNKNGDQPLTQPPSGPFIPLQNPFKTSSFDSHSVRSLIQYKTFVAYIKYKKV